mmetsp:Transcript_12640/g.36898  ORF Transcript_12640/g.36898 Transcript_12640/m.36898 type:complete len:268 (+) Transcript_12640:2240-3043(+)
MDNLSRRDADHGCARRHLAKHHAPRANLGARADDDVAKDRHAGAYRHIISQLWMAVAALLPSAPQSHVVEKGAVVADDGSLTDHNALRVVEHDTFPDDCSWVDVHAKDCGNASLQHARHAAPPDAPESVCNAVRLEAEEALVVQEGVGQVLACRVARTDCQQVFPDGRPDRPVLVVAHEDAADEPQPLHGRHGSIAQFLRQVVAERVAQRPVRQDGREHERAKARLLRRDLAGLAADLQPQRAASRVASAGERRNVQQPAERARRSV